MSTYVNGLAPIVTVHGAGTLHHLAYASNSMVQNTVGTMPAPVAATDTTTVTNFVLGFSYTFTDFAFYWDGAAPATGSVAKSGVTWPVGTSWTNATRTPWGTSEIILGQNVESQVATALVRPNEVVVYVIPGGLD
ncbi:hypothetical protein R3P38DRAFT_2575488 [Favolaschia claudopus]|uniref:Uncharacterized protein n=1 Tax=Favolaschia claudopus TaxID=2862362 RepID=A0AAV9ZKV6_9AGAR